MTMERNTLLAENVIFFLGFISTTMLKAQLLILDIPIVEINHYVYFLILLVTLAIALKKFYKHFIKKEKKDDTP